MLDYEIKVPNLVDVIRDSSDYFFVFDFIFILIRIGVGNN